MIKEWDIVISGFTQGPERESGAEKLHTKMEQKFAVPGERRVKDFMWKADWKAEAERMWRLSGGNSSENVKIRIYAYSWGGGWGFTKLSKYLMRCGMQVECAVLCDPVYRSWFLPTWFKIAPLSMTRWIPEKIGWPNIKVYPNVENVTGIYQRQNRPSGHPLKIVNPELTTLHDYTEVIMDHQHIDDSAAWHELSLLVADEGPSAIKEI